MKVSYYLCTTSSLQNFSYCSRYIRIRDSEEFSGKGIYLNGNHELECVPDAAFREDENKLSVIEVMSIYNCADGSIMAGNKYGVYKIGANGEYYIFNEKFRYSFYPKEWFISINEWRKIPSDQEETYFKMSYDECKKLDNTSLKKKEEDAKEEENKKELKKRIELINSISNTIAKNTGVSITKTISHMPKNICAILLLIAGFEFVLAFFMKEVLFGIVGFWTLIAFLMGRKTKDVLIDKEIKIDLQNYERLLAMNKLPLTMLGKIQQIQNYMTIMRYRQVNEEIILLVEQSVNLTVFTTIQDDYYSSNKEEIDERLNEFLDNTLEYIKTSLQNKDMEIYQIKKNLSEDYLKMIDKNSEMFKSITKDLSCLSDIFENKDESNKEENKEIKPNEEGES